MPKCLNCHGPIVKFGRARKNGKDQVDWNGRQYHKKCYKTLTFCETFFYVPYALKEEAKKCGARWNAEVELWFAPNNAVKRNMRSANFEMYDIWKEKNTTCGDCQDTGTIYYCDDIFGPCPHCEKGEILLRK